MSCGFQQWCPSLLIQLIDIGFRVYESLTYVKVLLHACECEWWLPSLVFFAGIRPEPEQQLHYLQVPVDTRLHQRCQCEWVLPVDVKELRGVDLVACEFGSLKEDTLGELQVTAAGCDVQGVATVFVGHCQIHVLLEEKVYNVELVTFAAEKKGVLKSVILHVRVCSCFIYQVLYKHVICLFCRHGFILIWIDRVLYIAPVVTPILSACICARV